MSTNSKIEWTDHTFNPWWGCTKVHQGCTHCYAETLDKRYGESHWGNNPRRMIVGEWGKPEKWNRDAMKDFGRPARVFCASMCDLFEKYDGPVVNQQGDTLFVDGERVTHVPRATPVTLDWLRARVFQIVEKTPNLEWLFLTKRPENVPEMVPERWLKEWPRNVMTGTSPCDQETADECIPHLRKVPGRRFLSCEPLLGPIDLPFFREDEGGSRSIHWVIVGVESRGKRVGRFADGYEDAARSIITQCDAAGVPCFNKQMPIDGQVSGDPSEWPEDLRVRDLPGSAPRMEGVR